MCIRDDSNFIYGMCDLWHDTAALDEEALFFRVFMVPLGVVWPYSDQSGYGQRTFGITL